MYLSPLFSLPTLAISTALIFPSALLAQPAGIVQFSVGEVNARGANGEKTPLIKGSKISSGESIITGDNAKAQLIFSDGGSVSLQSGTELRIMDYSDRSSPRDDRFLVDLVRGGLRAITGLIGKRNRENYKVTAKTATIGIRGSAFHATLSEDGLLSVTTERDEIELCNAGLCIGLTEGESAVVRGAEDTPIRIEGAGRLPIPGPMQSPLVIGNQVNESGTSRALPATPPTTVPAPPLPPPPPPLPPPSPASAL